MSAGDALLDRLPDTTLVLGKGGVGKTTCAAALALRASVGNDTLVLSTDPARALPDVLAQPLGSAAEPLRYAPRLSAQILDADHLRARYLERWGDVLRLVLDRGTYLDADDIGPLVDTALPGGDEIFAALELARLFADRQPTHSKLFVDTAPTGHTLRLLQLPQTFRALVRLLDAMQDKHRFMVRTLTRAYRTDAADGFIVEMDRLVSALEDTIRDPNRCAAILIVNDQRVVLDESIRYLAALRDIPVDVAAVIWNGVQDGVVRSELDVEDQYVVRRFADWPTGPDGLRKWFEAMAPAGSVAPERRSVRKSTGEARRRPIAIEPWLSPLTIVAGKGGVGKTTVACALAIRAADHHRTLLVSTDPASSLADALEQPIPDADTPIAGVPNLFCRQMDATAAFGRMRTEYTARVDALFDGLVGRGVDITQDRAIARDLLSLAPPGVDEVYALTLLSDALFEGSYERVIVDPAPTGHMLRLLEMPQLALAWSHQLMRLMLKYKDLTGLGETAQELLEFSRRLRALDALLRDSSRTAVVLVTLEEPVVQAETRRLGDEVRRRGVQVGALVLNRTIRDARPESLPVADTPVHLQAPAVDPPPVGVDTIRRWAETWVSPHALHADA